MSKVIKLIALISILKMSLYAESSLREYFHEESLKGKNRIGTTSSKDYGFSFVDLSNKFFVGGLISYSNINIDRKDGSQGAVTLNKKLEESAYSYSLELGYKYSEDIDFLFTYQKANHSNISLDNYYISSLYNFDFENDWKTYAGINLGYSNLKWDEETANTANNDLKSSSMLYGLNLGALYKIDDDMSLNLNYQANLIDHKTFIEVFPSETTLKHNFLQTLGFGIRYLF